MGRYDIINSFVRLDLETNVDKKLQRAILDLLHTKTRETNSCQYWAYHSGEMRYCELEEIQRTSRERARIIEGIGPCDADHFFQDHAVPVDGPNYCAPRLEDATWTQAVAASLKNHDSDVTVLYKVIDIGHISGFWTRDTNGNNTYDLAKLVDDWFVSSKNVFATHNGISQGKIVFHEYIHTAEAEAAYAWRRATRSGSIAILTLTLRNNDIRQLERSRRDAVMYQRWTKSDWKLYTWYCMSKIWVPQNMPHLQRYSNADLLIRTMAHREFEHYASIRGENDLRTHKPKEFLYVPEELGRSNETTLSFLLEKGTFNAYLVTSTNIKAMPKIQQLKRVNWQFGTLETDQCDRDMEEDEDEDEVEHDLWDEYYPVLDSDIDMGD
ncbi:hypothetical protein Sste5346_005586 [Sporothrix stenoceras]|uniref:HNH nuclease domain-containing protein n=1 Tax=Sporothrix stenoceras TaxID=5173 RepID=A0ABR3Z3T9_9PEZI